MDGTPERVVRIGGRAGAALQYVAAGTGVGNARERAGWYQDCRLEVPEQVQQSTLSR